jgi:Tfp pilus assembly protein PilV
VLVATTIMVVGVAALAQLTVLAARANRTAHTMTVAAVLAQQKMEQLRGLGLSPSRLQIQYAGTGQIKLCGHELGQRASIPECYLLW